MRRGARARNMAALLALPAERVAQERRRADQIAAADAAWQRAWHRRMFWLVVKCGTTYIAGGILAWSSFGLTGDTAQIALWGGLLVSNAGPMIFGYAFWMREQGIW